MMLSVQLFTQSLEANVEKNNEIQTNELHSYKGLEQKGYTHNTANQKAVDYVSKKGATVNLI